jgi:hypothetical protein
MAVKLLDIDEKEEREWKKKTTTSMNGLEIAVCVCQHSIA